MAAKTTSSGKLPRGVAIREYAKGDKLQITFFFRGVRCREQLNIPVNNSNIRFAANFLGEVENAISRQTFDYRQFFPESKQAAKFGYTMVADITIGQMLKDYLELAEKTLSPSTVKGYKAIDKAHLTPQFGKTQVRDLSAAMLRTWISGLTLTPKRIRNILTPLANVLDQAVTDEIIQSNPLDKIVLSKLIPRENKSTFEVDPFGRMEIRAIVKAAPTLHERFLWQFAFSTGLRTSELIALRWLDIDCDKMEIHVCRAIVKGPHGMVEKDPKTYAGIRKVPLLPAAAEALNGMKGISYMGQAHVFLHPVTGSRWADDEQLRKASWTHILRKAGVRYRNPYQTRHTFASTLLANGESELFVAKLLGHETTEMVRRHYGRYIKSDGLKPRGDYSDYGTGSIPEGGIESESSSQMQD